MIVLFSSRYLTNSRHWNEMHSWCSLLVCVGNCALPRGLPGSVHADGPLIISCVSSASVLALGFWGAADSSASDQVSKKPEPTQTTKDRLCVTKFRFEWLLTQKTLMVAIQQLHAHPSPCKGSLTLIPFLQISMCLREGQLLPCT